MFNLDNVKMFDENHCCDHWNRAVNAEQFTENMVGWQHFERALISQQRKRTLSDIDNYGTEEILKNEPKSCHSKEF